MYQFRVTPRHNQWTLRNVHDILVECNKSEHLQGATPLPIAEGGFQWPSTGQRQVRTSGVVSAIIMDEYLLQRSDIDEPMMYTGTTILCRSKGNDVSEEMMTELADIFDELGHHVHRQSSESRNKRQKKCKWSKI